MDAREELLGAGFDRVIALDAAECGVPEGGTLLLALRRYAAETDVAADGAWIHPYYFASQQAYRAAAAVAARARERGLDLGLRDEIRLKPIFARLPMFRQGRSTLSYLEDAGSRFHVQTLLLGGETRPDLRLLDQPQRLPCGSCHQCYAACPTGALDEQGFHREKCLRHWMLSGKEIPAGLRPAMGNKLLGCDACQRCCPWQSEPTAAPGANVPLAFLLSRRDAARALAPRIGANLALPNRLLAQACVLAGNSGDKLLLPLLRALSAHPSAAVAAHAAWAAAALADGEDCGISCSAPENGL